MITNKLNNKKALILIIILISIIVIYLTLNVIATTWRGFNWWFIDFKKTETANYATLIGGLFSIISTLLIIYTVYIQIKQNSEQNTQFTINQFEHNYFKLIDFHRDIISEFKHIRPDKKNEETNVGIIVFKRILEQFFEAYEEIDKHLTVEKINYIYINEKEKRLKEGFLKNIIADSEISLLDLHLKLIKINIAYLTVFYGMPEKDGSDDMLTSILSKTYNIKELDGVLKKLKERKTVYYPHQKYFGGHQSRLGQYYRNLYRSIKYVDSKAFLNAIAKKDYTKLFRSQFSNYEQAIIFINSLSTLGKKWEYNDSLENNKQGLITKYELIKNIPQSFFSRIDINPEHFYPLIQFEYEN